MAQVKIPLVPEEESNFKGLDSSGKLESREGGGILVSLKDWPRCHFGAFHPDEPWSLGPAAGHPRCSNPAGTWPVWGFPFPQLSKDSSP